MFFLILMMWFYNLGLQKVEVLIQLQIMMMQVKVLNAHTTFSNNSGTNDTKYDQASMGNQVIE